MDMKTYTQDGVLVLADISGVTEFVTATELEHGPQIIAALLQAVPGRPERPRAGGGVFSCAAGGRFVGAAPIWVGRSRRRTGGARSAGGWGGASFVICRPRGARLPEGGEPAGIPP